MLPLSYNFHSYWTLPAAAAFAIWTLSDCVYPHLPPSVPYAQCYYISPATIRVLAVTLLSPTYDFPQAVPCAFCT